MVKNDYSVKLLELDITVSKFAKNQALMDLALLFREDLENSIQIYREDLKTEVEIFPKNKNFVFYIDAKFVKKFGYSNISKQIDNLLCKKIYKPLSDMRLYKISDDEKTFC
jgi:hypothetical protein